MYVHKILCINTMESGYSKDDFDFDGEEISLPVLSRGERSWSLRHARPLFIRMEHVNCF